MEQFLEQLHFIRTNWFFALIPLLLLTLLLMRSQKQGRNWQSVIEPKLLPYLLVGKSIKHSSLSSVVLFLTGFILIVSLAGPAWEKRPQPVFKEKSALVIALDLSRSMNATDIKPSRLARARHKIIDILKQRKLGQTALLVYAADAFVVSPLTDDTATITSLLDSLSTNIMPSQGTRTDKALKLATSLFDNASIKRGDILLVTDGIEDNVRNTFEKIAENHRISILAIATQQGAPIPSASGGFVKDRSGAIVVPMLKAGHLQQLANTGRGNFSVIHADNSDIQLLGTLFNMSRFEAKQADTSSQLKTDSWYEQGPWLLLLTIPFVAYIFRRGVLFLFVILLIQQPEHAQAASFWDKLWLTPDQIAAKKYDDNKPAEAANLFNNKQWKAAAHYKNKQYQQTIDALKDINTDDAHYNKGNAYAKLGQIEHAISEYNTALKLNPDHKDALYNKKLLQKQQQNQKSQNSNNQQTDQINKQQSQSNSDNVQKNQQQQGKQAQNSENKSETGKTDSEYNKDNSNSNGENSSDKDSETSENEQNKAESKEERPNKDINDKQAAKNGSQNTEAKQNDEQSRKTQQLTKQWLRRIPDDPGGLMRNKFRYQYKRQQQHRSEEKNW